MYTKFNINDTVKVKLTEYGKYVLRKEWEHILSGNPNFEYMPPQEDDEGYSTWQMWSLMETFGKYITMTGNLPFETNILIELKWSE